MPAVLPAERILDREGAFVEVKGGNQPARRFYTRAGYSEYEVELEKRLVR